MHTHICVYKIKLQKYSSTWINMETSLERAVLNTSWKQQLYSHLLWWFVRWEVRRRHARLCWGSKGKLISNVYYGLLHFKPARIYKLQLCANTGPSREDRPKVMDNSNRWQESQVIPCYQYDFMMIILIYINTCMKLMTFLLSRVTTTSLIISMSLEFSKIIPVL